MNNFHHFVELESMSKRGQETTPYYTVILEAGPLSAEYNGIDGMCGIEIPMREPASTEAAIEDIKNGFHELASSAACCR